MMNKRSTSHQSKSHHTFFLQDNLSEIKVAFQGGRGSFSEQALIDFFGEEVTRLPFDLFSKAYQKIIDKECDFGVLPIENTLVGTIHPSFDMLSANMDLKIIGDYTLRIEHALLGVPHASIKDISAVYSQWPGLEQCRKFLDAHEHWETIPCKDTAAAAEYVAQQNNKSFAAIASERNAGIYGLKILKHNIESNHRNYTRFAIVVNKHTEYYALWKDHMARNSMHANVGMIIFTMEDSNAPGSLFRCMSVFFVYRINLLKIESRPILGKPWQYQFTVELELNQENIQEALLALEKNTKHVHVIGMYHRIDHNPYLS